MNKEQAKIKLETDIINYQNKIKFLDPRSIYTRWITDAKIYAEMELRKLKNTGEHRYNNEEWKDSYIQVLSEREILEFLLSNKQFKFKLPIDKPELIPKEIQLEARDYYKQYLKELKEDI